MRWGWLGGVCTMFCLWLVFWVAVEVGLRVLR